MPYARVMRTTVGFVLLLVAGQLTASSARAGDPALEVAFQAAISRCMVGNTGRDACVMRTKSERKELEAIAADADRYTAAWAESASDDELAAATPKVMAEIARARSIWRSWGHEPAPMAVDPTASLDTLVANERVCRASTKCLGDRAKAKAEADFFVAVVNPMCVADQDKEFATADIQHERSNPSGYVDARRVYTDGGAIQHANATLAQYAPEYQARRHHPWRGWRSECHPNPAAY